MDNDINDIYDEIQYYFEVGESIYMYGGKLCEEAFEELYDFNEDWCSACIKISGKDFTMDSLNLTEEDFKNKYFDKALLCFINDFDIIAKEKKAIDNLLSLVEDENIEFIISSTKALDLSNYDEDIVAGLSGFTEIYVG